MTERLRLSPPERWLLARFRERQLARPNSAIERLRVRYGSDGAAVAGVIAVIGATAALAEVLADGLLIGSRARGRVSDAAYALLVITGALCVLLFVRIYQMTRLGRAHRKAT